MSSVAQKTMTAYLSGSIKKGHENSEKSDGFYWHNPEKEGLVSGAPNTHFILLDPSERTDDLRDPVSILGRDMLQVIISDVVLVDARHKRGIGVGAELDRAETQDIPLVMIAPQDTFYHKLNTSVLGQDIPEWKHPFIFGYTDYIAQTCKEAGQLIDAYLYPKQKTVPNSISNRIVGAMQHYIRKQLAHDKPMCDLYVDNQIIQERIDIINNL